MHNAGHVMKAEDDHAVGKPAATTAVPPTAPLSSVAVRGGGGAGQTSYVDILTHLVAMKGLLNHHTSSFDHFILVEMKRILLNESNREIKSGVDPDFFIRYTDIRVDPPRQLATMGTVRNVTPHECRLTDATYMGDISVDIEYMKREGSSKRLVQEKGIKIGSVPIMLRSKRCHLHGKSNEEIVAMRECPLDPGGYFVVRGVERVCLVQEQQSKNRIIIEADDHGDIVASVQSKTHYSISKCTMTVKRGRIVVQHRSFTDDIPVVVLLKALGMASDQVIMNHLGTSPEVEQVMFPCFEQAVQCGVRHQNEALHYIGARRKDTMDGGGGDGGIAAAATGALDGNAATRKQLKKSRADEAADFLGNVLLCHIREGKTRHDWNFRHKALYVCCMIRRMVEALGDPNMLDERDSYGNKRFETTGMLMGLLFEDVLKQFNRIVRTAADQHLSKKDASKDLNLVLIMSSKSRVITERMVHTLSSGNWELKRFNMSRAGVTQVLSRQSYISALGMMTRLSSSFEKSRKISGPRSLQPSQWGMVCPCDTPEGESCGLVKNFSVLSQVTLDLDDTPVRNALMTLGVEELDTLAPKDFRVHANVFLNGTLIGIHRQPHNLSACVRSLRRCARLHCHVTVYVQPVHNAVHVSSDGGRIVRLYMIVAHEQPKVQPKHLEELRQGIKTISDFLAEGLVEFLDVNEANDCLIAVYTSQITRHTTHLEVEPFSLLGVVAGIIPFPHHNQSARNTFQCAMGKQALGAIAYNQMYRTDTVLCVGMYPQRPLCRTQAMQLTGYERLGAGINAMVCVMSYSGYDIEDAQVYNRAALDRGYGRCIVLRKYDTVLKFQDVGAEQHVMDLVAPPPADRSRRNERFHALGPDGIVSKGARVHPGDVLVNKMVPMPATAVPGTAASSSSSSSVVAYKPAPVVYRGTIPAIVDHVIVGPHGADSLEVSVKVIVRDVRIPEPGDKFSSRHGQKGVVGLITDASNLPFNAQGMTPDMIMNPHGFPSRMTVGKLMELMAGKAGILDGRYGDATAFCGETAEDCSRRLVSHGLNYHGKDLFYSGISGEAMPAFVFFGPIYYQRLKHMVVDKMHARSTGPRSMLTRQPTEGRARDGGLRVGEMERDCMVGYGAAMLLNERLLRTCATFAVTLGTMGGARTAGSSSRRVRAAPPPRSETLRSLGPRRPP